MVIFMELVTNRPSYAFNHSIRNAARHRVMHNICLGNLRCKASAWVWRMLAGQQKRMFFTRTTYRTTKNISYHRSPLDVHTISHINPSVIIFERNGGRGGAINHQQLDCLFNVMCRPTARQQSKLRITGPLWWKSHRSIHRHHFLALTSSISEKIGFAITKLDDF